MVERQGRLVDGPAASGMDGVEPRRAHPRTRGVIVVTAGERFDWYACDDAVKHS